MVKKAQWIARAARLHAARDFVERNLHRSELTPELTARALLISVRQLHLLFEPTGTSFSRYVLARRLERVRFALEVEPNRKVIEIALACGIESSTVFYRGFRAAFGVSPTEYRRRLLQQEAGSVPPYPGKTESHPDAALPAG